MVAHGGIPAGFPGSYWLAVPPARRPASQRRELENELRELYLYGIRRAGVTGHSRRELDRDLAFATMAMTVNGVIGGANCDMSQPRNGELFATVSQRMFAAALDGNCVSALP